MRASRRPGPGRPRRRLFALGARPLASLANLASLRAALPVARGKWPLALCLTLLAFAGPPRFGAAAGDLTALTLAGGAVSLEAPGSLWLATSDGQLLVASSPPPCDPGFDYCFYLPPGTYAGSNFRSAGVRIEKREELRAPVSCLLAQPAGWSDLQPGVNLAESYSASRFGSVGEGAAGSFTSGELRRLFAAGACWEFETRLAQTRFENFAPGAVREFTAAEGRAVEGAFESLLTSVSVAGEPVAWPASGQSDLSQFVRVDLPEVATSPLILRGEAVGVWFFEGSFPVRLLDEAGNVLAQGVVSAREEWMTEAFVPFEGVLEFEVAAPTAAILELRRDNPSDLPEHDAAVRRRLTLR